MSAYTLGPAGFLRSILRRRKEAQQEGNDRGLEPLGACDVDSPEFGIGSDRINSDVGMDR